MSNVKRKVTDRDIKLMKAVRDETGASYETIGRIFGVHEQVALYWVNDVFRARRQLLQRAKFHIDKCKKRYARA